MTLAELPTKTKERTFFKIQLFEKLYWKELPKMYGNIELARNSANSLCRCRIVKRTDKGWEIVEEAGKL